MTQVFEPLILRKYRDDVVGMSGMLPAQTTLAGRIIGYHLGLLDRDGAACVPEPGDLIRSSLCLWAAQACGDDARAAVPLAVGIELFHKFLAIHADIQDGTRSRNGRATAWEIWGLGQAVNAGDALHGLAMSVLCMSEMHEIRIARIFATVMTAVSRQIAFRRSGALMGACFEAAADAAGAPEARRRVFRRIGRHIGLALHRREEGDPACGSLGRARELLVRCGLEREQLAPFDEMAEYIAKRTQ